VQLINPAAGTGTGILFRDYDEAGLAWAITRALELFEDRVLWQKIMQNGMAMDYSWQRQGEQYVKIFRRLASI
ncbi:MAG: hypothetical protein OEU90_15235, partial [Gammaproteobacteria bacterium]|nr:hypothetical protein [Gammaproteobacteria bacterium]